MTPTRRALTGILAVAVLLTALAGVAVPAPAAAADGPAATTITASPSTPGPYPEGSHVTFDVTVTSSEPGNVRGAVFAEGGAYTYFADVDLQWGRTTLSIPELAAGTTTLRFRFEPQGFDQIDWLASETTVEITAGPPSTEFTARFTPTDVYYAYGHPTTAILERFRCDGELYTGEVSVSVNGAWSRTGTMVDGNASIGGLYPNDGFDQAAAPQLVTGVAEACAGTGREFTIGTFTSHSRRPTLTATVRGPGPHPPGSRVVIDVAAPNTGPELTSGTLWATGPDGTSWFGQVDGGAGTVVVDPLPAGTTELTIRFEDFTLPTTWWAAQTTVAIPVVETPTATVTSAPGTGVAGDPIAATIELTTTAVTLTGEYAAAATVSVDGATVPATITAGPAGDHAATVAVEVPGSAALAPGNRAVAVSFAGVGELAAVAAGFDVDVTARPVSLAVTAPASVTRNTSFDVTVTLDGDVPELPADGTVTIYDGADPVGSAPAEEGPTTVNVTGSPDAPTRALSAHLDGATYYHADPEPFTVDVAPTGTTIDGELTYTAPAAADTTGLVTGRLCITPAHGPVGSAAFDGAQLTYTLTHGPTGSTRSGTLAVTDDAGCWGHDVTFADLAAGEHTLTVTFAGNGQLAASTATMDLTVERAPTGLTLDVVGDPGATFGEPTTLRATLTNPVPGHTRGGTVTFHVDGEPVGTVTPTGNTAELSVQLPAGDGIEVIATYTGDEIHAAANSGALTFDVAAVGATLELTVTPERVTEGEPVTFTATVVAGGQPVGATSRFADPFGFVGAVAGHLTATGDVTFYVNGTPVGTHALAGGVASMEYILDAGANTVTASYSGSAEVAAVAAGADVTVVVNPAEQLAPTPPTAPEAPDADAGSAGGSDNGPDGVTGAGAERSSADLARTGGGTSTLVPLAMVLLAGGAVLTAVRRRR